MDEWIDLERAFSPIPREATDRVERLPARRASRWDDILALRCVVLLGEAGTGKTSELRARTASLSASDRTAFFLPLEDVAAHGVDGALGRSDSERLARWRSMDGPAWLMLDSVDESKLAGQRLDVGLRRIAREFADHAERVRVVVSSRPSDWAAADDVSIAAFVRDLGMGGALDASGARELVPLFQLAPLDAAQVARLAGAFGVGDVQRFIDAVRSANAWSFAERPYDVRMLVAYWREHHRLGALREIVEFAVRSRLDERHGRPSFVSPDRAREGAKRLAFVATVTGKTAFRLPGVQAGESRWDEAIDPAPVLSDWTAAELGDLLRRGLFDEATYGRARIHHRNEREYLAAERFRDLLDAGYPRAEVHRLLFAQTGGRTVVPLRLAPVVAWLSLWDPEVKRTATRVAPEQLIDEGDPSGLTPDDRRATLQAYAAKFADRERVFHRFDPFGLRRFACPELAAPVRELLASDDTAAHVKEALLEIAQRGEIRELGGAAVDLALNDGTPPSLRFDAVRTAAAVGDRAERLRLRELAATPAAADPSIAAELIDKLFPEVLTLADVTALLQRVQPPERTYTTFGVVAGARLPERCSPEQRLELLRWLVDRAPGRAAAGDDEVEGNWAIDALARLLADASDASLLTPEDFGRSLDALDSAIGTLDHSARHRTSRVLAERAGLRRAAFWFRAEQEFARNGAYPRHEWDVKQAAGLHLSADDAAWLAADCVERPHARERLLAFRALISLAYRTGGAQFAQLEALADAEAAAHSGGALRKRLARELNRPAFSARRPWELMHEAADRRRDRSTEASRAALTDVIAEIRSGANFDALRFLYGVGQDHATRPAWEAFSPAKVAERFGPDLANAAVAGLRAFWRTNEAPPLDGNAAANQTPTVCVLALAGLALEASGGVEIASLEPDLFRRAIAHGGWELNGFPEWFAACAARDPAAVRSAFSDAVRADFEAPASEHAGARLLWKLPHASPAIRAAFAPLVMDLLAAGDPGDSRCLKMALGTVAEGDEVPETLLPTARARCSVAIDVQRYAFWWRVWLRHDPAGAVRSLAAAVARINDPGSLVMAACAELQGRRDGGRRAEFRALQAHVEALESLVLVVFAHIRPEEDAERGGWYTPGPRHDVEEVRSALVSALADAPGPATIAALDRLADRPEFARWRDWLRHQKDVRAATDALPGLDAGEAARLARFAARAPANSEELFAIACDRLRDIRYGLAHDDFSVRDAYDSARGPVLEEPVQNFLAHELERARRGQYQVVREPEVTRRKKPDIRLYANGCTGPVTIEVKIAERWTFAKLIDAIETQLVGTYMAASDSRYGILVVCSSGPSHNWTDDAGSSLTFDEVVTALKRHAQSVRARGPRVRGLEVVAFDFH